MTCCNWWWEYDFSVAVMTTGIAELDPNKARKRAQPVQRQHPPGTVAIADDSQSERTIHACRCR